MGDDAIVLSTQARSVDLDAAIRLLAPTAIESAVAEPDFMRTSWLRDFYNGAGPAELGFERNPDTLLFGRDHPSGFRRPSEAHVWSQDMAEIASLRKKLLRPAHAILVVVGDTSRDAVVASATQWLGPWSGPPALARASLR